MPDTYGYNAERNLWCAVLRRLLEDASVDFLTQTSELEKQQVQVWFLRPNRDFRMVYELAGMDAE